MSTTLRGIFAPILTPVREDLSIDTDRWITQTKQLLNDGCHGVCPFGTTSEANSFGLEERMTGLEALIESGIEPAQMMPGTGTCAIPDTVRLTVHAVEAGCAGVLLLPPFYYKGVSDDGIFASIAEVIERVGDERLRVYLYHIPPIAQVGFSLGLIDRLIGAYPQTVVGIKDSSADWNNLHNLLTNFPEFAIFSGTEKFLLSGLRLGSSGTISAMANLIPGTLRYLYDNWLAENAGELQEEANKTRASIGGYTAIPAIKEVVACRLGDPEWRRVRPPLVALTEGERKSLHAQLELPALPA